MAVCGKHFQGESKGVHKYHLQRPFIHINNERASHKLAIFSGKLWMLIFCIDLAKAENSSLIFEHL